jgi:hypothetical protein
MTAWCLLYAYVPRSNMRGRKRPFTEKNGDVRRSYTGSIRGHRIRGETVRNGFRIRISYKNTERLEGKVLYSVYGRVWLRYTSLFTFTLKVSEHITISILWNSHTF